MNADEFATRWTSTGDKLEPFKPEVIRGLPVSNETKSFLAVGLPSEAAPFLTFGAAAGAFLQPVSTEFNLSSDYSNLRIIGFNAYGDPICIDETDGNVVYLNHDDNFGYVFMNSSVSTIAQFLIIIRDLINALDEATPETRLKLVPSTLKALQQIDPVALDKGGWTAEVESFFDDD